MRSGGAGIPFFYTRAGTGTIYATGQLVEKYHQGGAGGQLEPALLSRAKEATEHAGRTYLKEAARLGDVALIKAWKADHFGNLVFRETARNFNPVMGRAARWTVAEVEELVPVGVIDPDEVHLPGIYVDQIIHGGHYEKRVAHHTVQRQGPDQPWTSGGGQVAELIAIRERIARRAAREFTDGMYGKY